MNRSDDRKVHEEDEINLLELLHVIVKRKKPIVAVSGAVAIISVLYSLSLPNIYSATAKVLPPQKDGGGGLSALLSQAGGLAGLAGGLGTMSGSSDLYVGILKSRSVADQVIERLKLADVYHTKTMEATRGALQGAVKIQAGKDGMITVAAEDKDPQRAALIANTLVEELGKTSVRLNLSKASTERSFLEKRLELVKQDLKKAEEELKVYAQSTKMIQVETQASASIEAVARLKAELVSKEVQLAAFRTNQTDESAQVKALQGAIQKLKKEMGALSGRNGSENGIPSVGSVPGLGLDYARKFREFKIQEAVFEQLTKQYEVAKLNEAKDSASLQVLDDAVAPVGKSRPKRSIIVIVSTVTAFLVSVFIAFILEYLGKLPEEDRETLEKVKQQLWVFRRSR